MENIINNLVSIIIPTYNNQNTICRAIDSCFNQTYQNIEILVIDDGSTDNTKEILKKYKNDLRFNYYYQENQERSTARNHGLDLAKGEYIQFLDSDDEIYPTKIEKQVSFLNTHPEYFLVYCGVEYKDDLEQIIHTLEPKIDGPIDDEILKRNFFVVHSPIFRKTNVRFDINMNRLEDWQFWIYIVKKKKVAYIDEILCDIFIEKQVSKKYVINMIKGEISLYTKLRKKIHYFSKNNFLLLYYQFKRVVYLIFHILRRE